MPDSPRQTTRKWGSRGIASQLPGTPATASATTPSDGNKSRNPQNVRHHRIPNFGSGPLSSPYPSLPGADTQTTSRLQPATQDGREMVKTNSFHTNRDKRTTSCTGSDTVESVSESIQYQTPPIESNNTGEKYLSITTTHGTQVDEQHEFFLAPTEHSSKSPYFVSSMLDPPTAMWKNERTTNTSEHRPLVAISERPAVTSGSVETNAFAVERPIALLAGNSGFTSVSLFSELTIYLQHQGSPTTSMQRSMGSIGRRASQTRSVNMCSMTIVSHHPHRQSLQHWCQ